MQPVFNPPGSDTTDIVLLDRTPLQQPHLLKRGDIVTYRNPRSADECNIKRIIGLPGDRVTTVGYKQRYITVPPGHCWVEGDNLRHSDDSNKVGPVPMGLIRGRATRTIYPLSRWGSLERKLPVSRVQIANDEERKEAAALPLINDSPFAHIIETPI